jgi:pimeloyl-ACP methyl ester carboxylesterase
LRLPVLAMVGEHDLPDFVQIAAQIGRQVFLARTLVVPSAGHMANMESPAVVTQALLDFLQAVASDAK